MTILKSRVSSSKWKKEVKAKGTRMSSGTLGYAEAEICRYLSSKSEMGRGRESAYSAFLRHNETNGAVAVLRCPIQFSRLLQYSRFGRLSTQFIPTSPDA